MWLLWLWRGDEDTFIIEQKEKKRLWRRLLGSLLLGDEVYAGIQTSQCPELICLLQTAPLAYDFIGCYAFREALIASRR